MWIYSKPRNEHDTRFLLNLDQCSRINVTQLGEKWFVEVFLGSDSFPVAAAPTQEEAIGLMKRIFDSLKGGEKAFDLDAPPLEKPKERKESPPPQDDGHEPEPVSLPARGRPVEARR